MISEKEILSDILRLVENTSADWEMDFGQPINEETYLGRDLGFTSMDLVRLIAEIQRTYERDSIPFEELLIKEDTVVLDVQIKDLVRFLYDQLQ